MQSPRGQHAGDVAQAPDSRAAFVHESLPDSEVIHVFGDLDIANKGQLDEAVTRAARTARVVIVNLTQCTYIDSGALNILFRVHAWIGIHLQIVASSSGPVRRILDITGLNNVLDVSFLSCEDALSH